MRHWRARDVMTSDVISVTAETPYKEIVRLLSAHRISALPVVDSQNRVIGVVSEADLLHKLEFAGQAALPVLFERRRQRSARQKSGGEVAEDLMTSPAIVVGDAESVTTVARLMDAERVKRVPVVDHHGRLVGVVSRQDLLRIYLRDDDAIREEIVRDVLQRTLWIGPDELTVSVADGVATIGGTVDRRSTIELVVRLVQSVAGVVDVSNHLTYHFDDIQDRERARIVLDIG